MERPRSQPPAGAPGHERFRGLALSLSSVGYAVSRRFMAALEPFELHPREFAVLRTVGGQAGQSQQQLAERLQIPRSRMVAIVDQLETRGLLARRADASDRRIRELHLTDAGRGLLERVVRQVAAFEQELGAELDAQEREQLLDLLDRLGAGLGLEGNAHPALGYQTAPSPGPTSPA